MSNNNISKKSITNSPVSSNTSIKSNVKSSTNNTTKSNFTQNSNKQLNNKANTNSSFTNNSNSKSGSGSSVFGIIILVVVILFLIGFVYWVYKVYSAKTFQSFISAELMPDITDATFVTNIPASTIPSSSYSNEYAISFWMNIDDYNYNYIISLFMLL